MYNINEPIAYNWTFGWSVDGMSNPKPIVNRLLKAIIEKDTSQMEDLYRKNATLEEINKETFERVLYHVIDTYDVISWLVKHGMSSDVFSYCIEPDGYIWGLIARAWYLHAYDVMDLLAYHGFDRLSFCINGKGWNIESLIFERDDVRAMKILKEHGYIEDEDYVYGYPYPIYRRQYPNSKVTAYLEENPIIIRKSMGLDNFKFHKIPKPELERETLFHRKEIRKRNEIKIVDYNDRIRAQKEYLKVFSTK